MMASVSIAARESLRVSTVSLLNSHDRSFAVRKVHFPPIRNRLTPRVADSPRRPPADCRPGSRAPPAAARGPHVHSCPAAGALPATSHRAARPKQTTWPRAAEALLLAAAPHCPAHRPASPLAISALLRPPLFLAASRRRHAARIGYSTSSRLTLMHIERRKCRLLVHLHHAFTHHFECGGEARREHRGRKRWLYHERDQIFVEPRPVGRRADQPLERFTRLGQGPDGALDQAHMPENRLLPLLRVRREQIVECRGPFRTFDMGDGLGLATLKHVPIKLRAAEQALGGGPDRLEALEPHGERARHIFRTPTCRRIA